VGDFWRVVVRRSSFLACFGPISVFLVASDGRCRAVVCSYLPLFCRGCRFGSSRRWTMVVGVVDVETGKVNIEINHVLHQMLYNNCRKRKCESWARWPCNVTGPSSRVSLPPIGQFPNGFWRALTLEANIIITQAKQSKIPELDSWQHQTGRHLRDHLES